MRSDSHRAFSFFAGRNAVVRPRFGALITLITLVAAFAAGIAIGDSCGPGGIS